MSIAGDDGGAREAGAGGLRRALVLRLLGLGLVVLALALVVLGLQVQRTARAQARADTLRHARTASVALTGLFDDWRDELLVARSNAAYTQWFTRPQDRPALRGQVDSALVVLHDIYPDLIDEACFIGADGHELGRQAEGEAAGVDDLSPDESGNPFFAPSFALAEGQVYQASPYLSPDSGRWVVSNSTPLVVDGRAQAWCTSRPTSTRSAPSWPGASRAG